jgi:hypothetical protein
VDKGLWWELERSNIAQMITEKDRR